MYELTSVVSVPKPSDAPLIVLLTEESNNKLKVVESPRITFPEIDSKLDKLTVAPPLIVVTSAITESTGSSYHQVLSIKGPHP